MAFVVSWKNQNSSYGGKFDQGKRNLVRVSGGIRVIRVKVTANLGQIFDPKWNFCSVKSRFWPFKTLGRKVNLSLCKFLFVFLERDKNIRFTGEDLAVCSRMRVWKAGQHDRRVKVLASHVAILAQHCPLTDVYFEPCGFYCIIIFGSRSWGWSSHLSIMGAHNWYLRMRFWFVISQQYEGRRGKGVFYLKECWQFVNWCW